MAWGIKRGPERVRRQPALTVGAIALVAIAGQVSPLVPSSSAAGGLTRIGAPSPLASAARTLGAVSASARLHVTIVLKPRNPGALAAYAREVSTPGSSVYHAYLTPSQFAAQFGASSRAVRAVESSMRAHGLIVRGPAANRLAVPVLGTAAQIERAFAVSLRRVVLRSGMRAVLASAAPALDRSISGEVEAVLGLTSTLAPRPLLARAPKLARSPHAVGRAADAGAQACPAASSTAAAEGAHTADQIALAYGFGGLYASGAEGQGETVAIYELESYAPSDVAAYQSCYGTGASVTPVLVDGGPSGPVAGSGEAALDIEQVAGLAPRASILVYEGPNSESAAPGSGPYDTLSRIITDDRARVVSISWGQCEQAHSGGANVLNAEDTLFQEAAAQGQSVVSATGDQGSEDCPGNAGLAVDDPGSQPFVTGVGGTSLQSAALRPAETVWNRSDPANPGAGGAGGGGVSSAWQMPGYQLDAAPALQVLGRYSSGAGCANPGGYCRQVPDVAADADPNTGYLIYWSGSAPQGSPGWQAVGGTSAAAPLWAALLADADSSAACRATSIGFANPALYQTAAANYGNSFNDITTGNNDFTATNGGLYPAGPLYDMASGLGSPNAAALGPALCAGALRVDDPGPQTSTVGHRLSLRISTSALPGVRLKFYATGLPPGLSISASTGRITGRPKRIGTWRTGVAALGQNLSVRATFFNWHVGGAPTISGSSVAGVAAGHPQLRFTLTAGRRAAWLRTISLRLSNGLSIAHSVARRVSVGLAGAHRVAFTIRRRGARLQIVFAKPVWRVEITVRPGVIRASPGLVSAVRSGRPPLIGLAVTTTDAARHAVAVHAHVRPRS